MSEEIVAPIDPAVAPVEPVVPVVPAEPGVTLSTPPPVVDPNAKDGTADNARVAPEKYEDFTLPEGVEIDKGSLEAFLPVAKQMGLNQEEAQSLVDYEQKRVTEFYAAQETERVKVRSEWVTAIHSDKEIGGPAFDQSVANAGKFIDKYGTPELIQALNDSGMGDHPEFVRAFARAGAAMSEGGITIGGTVTPSRAAEDVLYPNQGKKEAI